MKYTTLIGNSDDICKGRFYYLHVEAPGHVAIYAIRMGGESSRCNLRPGCIVVRTR